MIKSSGALLALAVLVSNGAALRLVGETAIDFNRDIRPLLSDRCFFCHGPDEHERKAGLRLDEEADAKADRKRGAAIVPGNASKSAIMERILESDPDDRMPPIDSGKALDEAEIALLTRWIDEGAEWSQHWAYEQPKPQPAPRVEQTAWPRNWIDHWVLARLEAEGWKPSLDADPVDLVRRVSFDLVGLPPDPETVRSFLQNPSPHAYQTLVDGLLNSPQFGERMASYWLDLVRFADTVGYHGDQDHSISPYRDYVIDVFNDNVPFDQFTREQLAGDLLPDAGVDQQIASSYNRLLQTSHEGGVQAKEYLAIYAADRVRNLSVVWMGATMGCAQCHDHKYDPITSKDFYAMQAFFADLDETAHFKNGSNSLPTLREPEIKVLSRRERSVIDSLDREIGLLGRSDGAGDGHRLNYLRDVRDTWAEGTRRIMISKSVEPRTIRVLPRGNWLDDSGPEVAPAVPEFLGTLANPESGRAGRMDLANWLVDAESGGGLLTARVMVNRFWYLMFGAGLSRSLDDFGGQGEPPEYGELLDQLAVEFVRSGWDVKHILRLIATSRVYQQDSYESVEHREQDPYNRLLARQSRYRLPAEAIRDSLLAIGGLLDLEMGGASVRPYQPEGYYRHLNFPKREYEAHEDQRQWRRGVYVHWQRQFLHPMLAAFDAPSREECTAERPISNTPVSALVLLNDPSFVTAAEALARRMHREGGDSDESILARGFELALSRAPDEAEATLLLALVEPVTGDQSPAVGWVGVARAILNLSETITRP